MFDSLTSAITEFLYEVVGAELCTFIVSMIPIIELRGAIPIGQGMGLGFWPCYIISVIGNLLPVPIILLFVRVVLNWMKGIKHLDKIAIWVEKKADKHSGSVTKYATWGLFLFVAIPLPGTGAWTGALIAALLNMRMKKALPFIFAGVLTAGLIVSLLTFGVISILL